MIIRQNITEDAAVLRGLETRDRWARPVPRLGQDVQVSERTEVAKVTEAPAEWSLRVRQVQWVRDGLGAAVTRAQTQLGYMDQLDGAFSKMTQLGRQAADPTLTGPDRERVREEFGRLARVVEDLQARRFNGEPLFDGSIREVPVDTSGRTVALAVPGFDRPAYSALLTARVDTPESAAEAVKRLETATVALAEDRAHLQSGVDALLRAGDTLQIEQENLAAATVRLRDASHAELAIRQISARILVQSNEALQAQGHAQPERTLRLLE